MTRSAAVLPALTLLVWCASCSPAPPDVERGRYPVILISIDTLRSDRLPSYGYTGIQTPELDRFAADAVLFERAYTHYPMTLPAHASILTGGLPPRHGVRDNRGYRLDEGLPTLAGVLGGSGYRTAGFVSTSVLRRQTGIGRGFDLYDDAMGDEPREGLRVFPQRPGRETIAVAERWLDGLAPGVPFFLFLHLFEPHTPYEAPDPFGSRYGDPYDAEIAYTDSLLAGFFDGLRQRGLYDRSMIVLLSDHGEGLGDHGESEHGLLLYREALEVPLMFKLPGSARAGERRSAAVALSDVMPTVLDLVTLPFENCDGEALFGAEPAAAGRRIYSETWFPRKQYAWSELRSAIDGRLHFILAPRPELYDLIDDPSERRDLLGSRDVPVGLAAWLEETSAGIESEAVLSQEELNNLAALGYVGGAEVDDDWRDLPDPKDHVHRVEELWASVERIGEADDGVAESRVLELCASLGIRNEALFRTISGNLLGANRPAMALQVLEPYRDSEETATRLVLGKALTEVGRPGIALQRFRDVLGQEPDNVEAHLGTGIALLSMDRPGEARPHLMQVIELAPEQADAWNGLGVIQARRGDLAGAEQAWVRAVDLDPTLADTWFNLALLHRQMGDLEAAASDLRRYVELAEGPDRRRAVAMLRELERGPARR